jgi:hypothetical protein
MLAGARTILGWPLEYLVLVCIVACYPCLLMEAIPPRLTNALPSLHFSATSRGPCRADVEPELEHAFSS